ncbi:MAG: Coenzyme F420 hydrogenase/dehydrogenase, beta subunit C-terminal domain [Hadesarchaea archaeon]|nr:Coenzyme F420 hydrogenase/dehydrogenase, beta subunit C-terminal domain [Hadesarchaea archaeon]
MVKLIGDLIKDVIEPGFCLGCNACAAACPIQCIEKEENEIPVLKTGCINCGICYGQCPQVVDPKTLQKAVFGDNPTDELLGTYTQALAVEAKDAVMKAHGQDGGAVTALLSSLLDDGYIDGAVVVGTGEAPWQPVARVATTTGELIECAGSKYSRTPLFIGLRDAVNLYYRKRVAIVGTPCNIVASWRMQFSEPTNRQLGETIRLRVGLFCGGVFRYKEFLKDIIERQLRAPLAEVAKFDMKDGRFVIYLRHKPKRELALSAVKRYIDLPCKICSDFTAEFADISVGSAGSPHGRSTVLIRTPTGAEAFDVAKKFRKFSAVELEKVKPGIEEVRLEAKAKKGAAAKELEIMRRQKKPLPVWLQERPPEPPKETIESLKSISQV